MKEKRLFVLALLMFVIAPTVHALGLGDLTIHSAINQPLDAEIALRTTDSEVPSDLNIALAPIEAFQQAGLDRSDSLLRLVFALRSRPNGEPYIKVSTRESFREPVLNFLIQLKWPGGRLVRAYNGLLQLPAPGGETANSPQAVSSPRSSPSGPEIAIAGEYGPVRSNDTLWAIAQKVRPNRSISIPKMMRALVEFNPKAFIKSDPNKLRKGAILRIPKLSDEGSIAGTGTEVAPRVASPTAQLASKAVVDKEASLSGLMRQRTETEATGQQLEEQNQILRRRLAGLQEQLAQLREASIRRDEQLVALQEQLSQREASPPHETAQGPSESERVAMEPISELEAPEPQSEPEFVAMPPIPELEVLEPQEGGVTEPSEVLSLGGQDSEVDVEEPEEAPPFMGAMDEGETAKHPPVAEDRSPTAESADAGRMLSNWVIGGITLLLMVLALGGALFWRRRQASKPSFAMAMSQRKKETVVPAAAAMAATAASISGKATTDLASGPNETVSELARDKVLPSTEAAQPLFATVQEAAVEAELPETEIPQRETPLESSVEKTQQLNEAPTIQEMESARTTDEKEAEVFTRTEEAEGIQPSTMEKAQEIGAGFLPEESQSTAEMEVSRSRDDIEVMQEEQAETKEGRDLELESLFKEHEEEVDMQTEAFSPDDLPPVMPEASSELNSLETGKEGLEQVLGATEEGESDFDLEFLALAGEQKTEEPSATEFPSEARSSDSKTAEVAKTQILEGLETTAFEETAEELSSREENKDTIEWKSPAETPPGQAEAAEDLYEFEIDEPAEGEEQVNTEILDEVEDFLFDLERNTEPKVETDELEAGLLSDVDSTLPMPLLEEAGEADEEALTESEDFDWRDLTAEEVSAEGLALDNKFTPPEPEKKLESSVPEEGVLSPEEDEHAFDFGDQELANESGEWLQVDNEVDMKLDLAKAYMEMGAGDNARHVLEEILQEGDPEQQREAQEIMVQYSLGNGQGPPV